jgi:ABC-type dipeptide/oligopeptide/nickel transport system ATPase subunit
MDAQDEQDAAAAPKATNAESVPTLITATGLGVDGEHRPLFSDIDLALTPGFHAIQMPGGPGQTALLLTLAGRLKATHGTVTVLGDTQPRAIRRHCSVAAFDEIDELEESVTVQTVLAEQCRWLAPWYSRVPIQVGQTELGDVFGEIPPPSTKSYIVELSDLELFLLRITLALFSNRPILVVGDLEQVRDNSRRAIAVDRLGAIATQRTVVVGVTNPLGTDAPDHELHDHRILTGRD